MAACLIRFCALLLLCTAASNSEKVWLTSNYLVDYNVNNATSSVAFNITVSDISPSTVWVGFGVSKSGSMIGADMVIGGADADGATSYFNEYVSTGNSRPNPDPVKSWTFKGMYRNDTATSLTFSRPFNTSDSSDIKINNESMYMIWAFGNKTGEVVNYHQGSRGKYVVNFFAGTSGATCFTSNIALLSMISLLLYIFCQCC